MKLFNFVRNALVFIRFSHTVFALPFALGSMVVAAHGFPSLGGCARIVLAMVFARTAAMCFNRLADWELDKRNPRTAARHKLMSWSAAVALVLFSAAAFVATTFFINPLCLKLSPVALAIIFFYSLTKRFTALSHFFLGLALAVSPVGAWLAVRGRFEWPPLVLAFAVLCWVAGFDLIYATQDVEFDKSAGLRSMVVRIGITRSLVLAQALHVAMWLALVAFGLCARMGGIYYGGIAVIVLALVYEHHVARALDLDAINRAFFKSNALVGFVFLAAVFVSAVFY